MIWQIIRQNERRSLCLLAGSALFLALFGAALGYAWGLNEGMLWGALLSLGLWAGLYGFTVAQGQSFLVSSMGGRPVTHEIHPVLWNVTDEVRIAAGLKAMPRVWVIPDEAMNAFACGPHPDRSSVAVTSGLLEKLSRDELQGVIAHEMSHITNRDTRFMTLAAVMVLSVKILSELALRSSRVAAGSSMRRYQSRGRSRGAGAAGGLGMIAAIVAAILAPVLARLLYLALSRKREYLADACGARLTRHPLALASALEKISAKPGVRGSDEVKAAFFIEYPGKRALGGWLATHPPVEKRIAVLRKMAGEESSEAYEKSYRDVTGKSLLKSWSSEPGIQPIAATPEAPSAAAAQTERDRRDFLRAVNGWIFSDCECGVSLRIPDSLGREGVACPSCGRRHFLPGARPSEAASGSSAQSLPRLKVGEAHTRHAGRWESFACPSGHAVTLSSAFDAPYAICSKCRVNLPIRYAPAAPK